MTHAAPAHPFDAVAAGYDTSFTDRPLGRWLRRMVWERMERAFAPGEHLLELGCGTGEDAIWLARRGVRVTATDASSAMLEAARRKAEAAGVGERVRTCRLDLQELARSASPGAEWGLLSGGYDGALSNFGPLNCVEDRPALARTLARLIRPGGKVVLVIMGPTCPWEIAWFLARGRPRTAFRRFRSGRPAHVGSGGSLPVWYPTHRRVRRDFAPHFKALEVAGIGLLLPPSEMGHVAERAPRLFARLAAIDRRLAHLLPWRWLNDHYLIVLERR